MFKVIDADAMGYETVSLAELGITVEPSPLPSWSEPPVGVLPGRSEAYGPAPRLDGSLVVDPEIHLPSPGMDVDIAYFYNSNNSGVALYGLGRTMSADL